MRTLDIKLAILLHTLASTPGCPNVGSMDFGERLTVGFGKWVSLLDILAIHVFDHIGRPLCQACMRRGRKARQWVGDGGLRSGSGRGRRTAREEAVFGEDAHGIEDEDDDWRRR